MQDRSSWVGSVIQHLAVWLNKSRAIYLTIMYVGITQNKILTGTKVELLKGHNSYSLVLTLHYIALYYISHCIPEVRYRTVCGLMVQHEDNSYFLDSQV